MPVHGAEEEAVRVTGAELTPMHDAETEVFLWFDICVINEHWPERFSKGFSDTLMEAVGSIGHTVLMLTPWDQPMVLSRSWCLWEMNCTEEKKCKLTICLTNKQRQAFLNVISAVQDAFGKIDSSQARAGSEADRDQIAKAIEAGVGFKALDGMIFARLRDWGLGVVQGKEAWLRAAAGGAVTTKAAASAAFDTAKQFVDQGRLQEAAALFPEVISGHEQVWGPTHTNRWWLR